MLEYVREGDVVVVSNFTRLARSTREMLQIVQDLTDMISAAASVALSGSFKLMLTDSDFSSFVVVIESPPEIITNADTNNRNRFTLTHILPTFQGWPLFIYSIAHIKQN